MEGKRKEEEILRYIKTVEQWDRARREKMDQMDRQDIFGTANAPDSVETMGYL